MFLIDTHAHIYSQEFDSDYKEVIENSIRAGITKMILPAIDSQTHSRLFELARMYPENLFPVIGLHPTSVKENYEKELTLVEKYLADEKVYAIGETGIDLYWDTTHKEQQILAFKHQIKLAISHELPIIIHVRNSFEETLKTLKYTNIDGLRGVFHCYSGNATQAQELAEMGFKIGIGGVVTYKNSEMAKVVNHIPLENIILETDSPYLTPAPNRGKRNIPEYLTYIAAKIAEIKKTSIEEVALITSRTACSLFNLI